jgi:hypothetical protein
MRVQILLEAPNNYGSVAEFGLRRSSRKRKWVKPPGVQIPSLPQQYKENNMKTRYESKCSPDHYCTNEEIQAIMQDITDMRNDTSILRYSEPTIEEMHIIVDTALNYKEKWYHSEVSLNDKSSLTDAEKKDSIFMDLYNKIGELGEEHGIYLTYKIDIDFEMPNPDDYDDEGFRKDLPIEEKNKFKENFSEHLKYRSELFKN